MFYLIAKIFSEQEIFTKNCKNTKNIIVHVGASHCEIYHHMFKLMGFIPNIHKINMGNNLIEFDSDFSFF